MKNANNTPLTVAGWFVSGMLFLTILLTTALIFAVKHLKWLIVAAIVVMAIVSYNHGRP